MASCLPGRAARQLAGCAELSPHTGFEPVPTPGGDCKLWLGADMCACCGLVESMWPECCCAMQQLQHVLLGVLGRLQCV
jgi:hypothetical protein